LVVMPGVPGKKGGEVQSKVYGKGGEKGGRTGEKTGFLSLKRKGYVCTRERFIKGGELQKTRQKGEGYFHSNEKEETKPIPRGGESGSEFRVGEREKAYFLEGKERKK